MRIIVAYLGFIAIGLNAGLLGLAWTPMRAEFNQPIEALGLLLLASTAGYLTTSFLAGSVTGRIGIGATIIVGGVLLTAGLALTGLLSIWLLMIPVYIVAGLGSGLIDAGLNAYVAEHNSKRALNWLHACFGVGTTAAPLLVTAVISGVQPLRAAFLNGASSVGLLTIPDPNDGAWRVAYWIVAILIGVITIGFFIMRGRWRTMAAQVHHAEGGTRIGLRDTLRLPIAWLGIVLFFFYAGMEFSPGAWMGSLYNEARGIPLETAGFWVSLYWGSFTVGRIFFGFIIEMIPTRVLMRLCLLGAVIGAALIWWNPSEGIGFFGLALLGFAQAPMFPVFISQTPGWVGARHTPNAIGFQVAAAGIGIAVIPALIGVGASSSSLEIVPPVLLITAIVVIVLYELMLRRRPETT